MKDLNENRRGSYIKEDFEQVWLKKLIKLDEASAIGDIVCREGLSMKAGNMPKENRGHVDSLGVLAVFSKSQGELDSFELPKSDCIGHSGPIGSLVINHCCPFGISSRQLFLKLQYEG